MSKSLISRLTAAIVFSCLALACGEERSATKAGFGSAQVGVSVDALSAADVTKVTLTISGADIAPNIVHDLVKTGGQWQGIVGNIPAGINRTFSAAAYDALGVKLYEGQVSGVTITIDVTTVVLILLQQVSAPDPFSNSVPIIQAVVASTNAVAPSGTVSLSVTASDPDGDPLTYAWTATDGSFDNAAAAAVVWTAPVTTGVQTLTITVSDGRGGSRAVSLAIDVQTFHGRGAAYVKADFNTWPDISVVSATPGRADVSQPIALAVTAVDNDGDALSYAWNDGGCGGSFDNALIANPTYTTPAVIPAGGTCTLSVAVDDGRGGSNTGSVVVQVGPPLSANSAPTINHTFQSSATVAAGGNVDLYVTATDPEGTAMTFSWSATGGVLGAPTTTPNDSGVTWTAPAVAGVYTVTITVTDAGAAATPYTFSITVP